ncbi:uridine kinase family protein [Saccharothrix obliqua]|uniref:uridine kinase family protein n=1 Tax=Saccharothrix obliqua TaxID=2861747 RepID=UPI001C5DA511|nr:(d)CMP kinase [Saccharothrix obliqua]MBW4719715.1 (d)CMP kinase [Saccharothrix obliqua]
MRLIAVDGPSGSGKSTFAAALAADLGAALVPTDHFATWDDPVSWWPRLVSGVLAPLWRGEPGRYRRVDWSTGRPRPGDWITVDVPEILVLEGVSAARRSIAPRLAEAVWVEVPDARTRLERAVARDGEDSRPHLVRWQAFERGWFAVDGAKDRADRVVTPG